MISCKDHTGKEWESRRKICKYYCEYYGVTPSTFVWRRMSGMSLEEALDNKTDNRCCEVSDHLGNRYKSMREIAKDASGQTHIIHGPGKSTDDSGERVKEEKDKGDEK